MLVFLIIFLLPICLVLFYMLSLCFILLRLLLGLFLLLFLLLLLVQVSADPELVLQRYELVYQRVLLDCEEFLDPLDLFHVGMDPVDG